MLRLAATGTAGMMGTRLQHLLPDDVQLVAAIDRAEGLDILDLPALLRHLSGQKIDALLHFAAFTDVNAAAAQDGDRQGSCFQINVVGTRNVIDLCRHLGCRLVHISTDYVFDGTKLAAYTEADQPNPIEWYGRTKYEAEKLVMESSINWCIARTAYPFVAEFPGKLDLVRGRIKQMAAGNLPPQFTDHVITPTFIDELVRALLVLAKESVEGIYHLVGDTSHTDFEISTLIAKKFGYPNLHIEPISLVKFNASAPRPYQQNMALSNRKFEQQFGDVFSSFERALAKMEAKVTDGI